MRASRVPHRGKGPPPGPQQPATALNPEAGQHRVTADPRALAAVDRTTAWYLAAHPYVAGRYGARGRAFTQSDGAWLVTLAEHEPAHLRAQLWWLAGLLAARGMPSRVPEAYLAFLAGALEEAVPEGREGWRRLRDGAAWLASTRRPFLSDEALAGRARWLDAVRAEVAASGGLPGPPEAAELLAVALADEEAGLRHAAASLVEWLGEPGRFDERWRAAFLGALAAWQAG